MLERHAWTQERHYLVGEHNTQPMQSYYCRKCKEVVHLTDCGNNNKFCLSMLTFGCSGHKEPVKVKWQPPYKEKRTEVKSKTYPAKKGGGNG